MKLSPDGGFVIYDPDEVGVVDGAELVPVVEKPIALGTARAFVDAGRKILDEPGYAFDGARLVDAIRLSGIGEDTIKLILGSESKE